jgi:hypothetical protein
MAVWTGLVSVLNRYVAVTFCFIECQMKKIPDYLYTKMELVSLENTLDVA